MLMIRLARFGAKKKPTYRVVVIEKERARDSKAVEVVGTYRPNSLSATNTTTFISQYLPDVFIMASMIYISAYQRNFGRANDDPQMAITYESQYQALLKGASVEESRKKFEASGWTSQGPAPIATPSR